MLDQADESMRYALSGDSVTCVSLGRMAGKAKPVSLTIGNSYVLGFINPPDIEGNAYRYWVINDKGLSRPYATARFYFERPEGRPRREDPAPETRAAYALRIAAMRARYLDENRPVYRPLLVTRDYVFPATQAMEPRKINMTDHLPLPGRRKIRLE